MVARLALNNTDDTDSSGTLTHISGMDFNNSRQGGAGSAGTNATDDRINSFVHIEDNIDREKSEVLDCTIESKTHNMIQQSPV